MPLNTTTGLYPPLLAPESRVAVLAPAGPVVKKKLSEGVGKLRYPVSLSDGVYAKDGFWAGSQKHRTTELQKAIGDATISAIWCARGGFGITTILDELDLMPLVTLPRWIIGNSDITALLIHLWSQHRLCSIHVPMAMRFAEYPDEDIDALHHILAQGYHKDACTLHSFSPGNARGPLVGGNLTMLAHMMGSVPPDFADGCVLFLEDVAEAPYRIERNLIQLKRTGVLGRIKGIVLGEFTHCQVGPDGVSVDTVLRRNLLPLQIPVASGYPAAHGSRNRPFVHGHPVSLTINDTTATLADLPLPG